MRSPRPFRSVGAWLLVALVVGGCVLFFFSPEKYGFYPHCPVYELTGWKCVGCGSTRALHHLLHGEFARAWRLNPFLPAIAVFFVAPCFWARLRGSLWWIGGFVVLVLVLMVVRNACGF